MSVLRRIWDGMGWGLMFSMIFSVWALVLMLITLSVQLTVRGHTVNGLHIIFVYLSGGAIAGALVGLLRPLLRWLLGAVTTGIVAAVPFFIGVLGSISGFTSWTSDHTIALVISALVLGTFGGLALRELFFEDIVASPPARKPATRQ